MLVDLQVSLTGKDGTAVDPQVLIEGAKKAGLDGLVVTAEPAQFPALDALRSAGATHDVRVFAGAHIPSNRGLLLCVLPDAGASLAPGWAATAEGVFDAEAVIDAVEAAGGVTIALRPYDRAAARPMGDDIFQLVGLAACETQSGRVQGNANDLALDAASSLELPCVGSSGASGTEGLGSAATLFRTPLANEGDLVEALRTGDCWPVSIGTRVPVGDGRGAPRGEGRREGGAGVEARREGGGAGGSGSAEREGNGRRRRRRGGRGRGGSGGEGRREDRPNGEQRAQAPRPEGGDAPRAEAPRREGGEAPRGDAPRREGGAEARDNRGNREPRRDGDGEGRRRRRGGRGRGAGGGGGGGERPGPGNGGGGGGGRGNVPEDIGNRVRASDRRVVDENAGNRVRNENESYVDENAGNRLRPGEQNVLVPRSRVVEDEDDGDNVGNR